MVVCGYCLLQTNQATSGTTTLGKKVKLEFGFGGGLIWGDSVCDVRRGQELGSAGFETMQSTQLPTAHICAP